jgi:hypothetical protein
MLSTRDVLRSSDAIKTIWKLGLQDDAMSLELIESTNIAEIASELLNRQAQFVFKLSSILLRGLTLLYYKKTAGLLKICQTAIERISLKFQTTTPDQVKIQEKPIMEVDDETLNLWRQGNLEAIVDAERREGPQLPTTRVFIETTDSITYTPPRVQIEDDFGEIPFTFSIRGQSRDMLSLDVVGNENETENESENENEFPRPNNEFQDGRRFVQLELGGARARTKIDEWPVIPMTQLSAILEDPSATLCHRPICKAAKFRLPTSQSQICPEITQLFDEAKKVANRYTPDDLPSLVEDQLEPLVEFPAPQLHIEEDQIDEQLEDEPEVDIVSAIRVKFQTQHSIGFTEIVPSSSRKDLSRSFFAALCLHNRGVIRLRQSDCRSEIVITPGEN